MPSSGSVLVTIGFTVDGAPGIESVATRTFTAETSWQVIPVQGHHITSIIFTSSDSFDYYACEANLVPFGSAAADIGSIGLAAAFAQSSNQTVPDGTSVDLSFENEYYNGLGLVTSDFVNFTPPQIGDNPIFQVVAKMEVRGKTGPLGRWLFAGNWQFPFDQLGAVYSDLGSDQSTDLVFGITDTYQWAETSNIVISAYQESGEDQEITNCLLQVSYLGQFLPV